MYIWRGKNRRDRRDFLLDGPLLWGPRKQDVDTDKQDDLLRHESEAEHMKFFHDKTRRVMFDYLLTPEGQEEIRLVAIEIDRVDAQYKRKQKLAQEKAAANAAAAIKDGKLTLEDVAEMAQFDPDAQEKERKKTVYEVFRKYDVDGSDSIDVFEMRKLLNEIKMKLTDEEFVALFKSLDTDGGGEIDFEEFYGCKFFILGIWSIGDHNTVLYIIILSSIGNIYFYFRVQITD